MKNQSMKILVTVIMAVSVSLASVAFASDAPGGSPSDNAPTQRQKKHHHFHKRMKEVFQACAKANGVTLPAKGSGEKLSSGDRTAFHACVKEFRQNVQACLQNAGVSKPQPGQKPSDADKAAFKQCRSQALSEVSGGAAPSGK